MLSETSVNLGNLLLSLSDAIDLSNPSISEHQMRTAFIAWQMARYAKTSRREIEKIFTGALFHDIGALDPDDKTKLHNFEENDLNLHCVRGAALFKTSHLLNPAAEIVKNHHRPWDNWQTDINNPDAFGAQVLNLADFTERLIKRDLYILHQHEDIIKKIISMEGGNFHPDVVEVFVAVAKREEFWLDLESPRLYSLLLHRGPFNNVEIDSEDLFSIASIFRNIIDFKSSFTATHSTGVAECASTLSEIFGLTAKEVSLMKLTGYFHDIGKLAVPNNILEKPGKLTKKEFAVIKKHTYFTYMVLNSVGGLGLIPEWAAFHHERLDGTGYPFHVNEEKISTGAKIMTVADIFTALAEDRPYRAGMERSEIERILQGMVKSNGIDKKITGLLFENYDEVLTQVRKKQAIATTEYRKFVAITEHCQDAGE